MANDGPIGRANVELGADTSKLEAGLSAAKEKTVAAVVATEKAAAAAVPVDDSERYQAKLQDMAAAQALERKAQIDAADAADRADRVARDRVKTMAAATAAASQAQVAAQAAVNTAVEQGTTKAKSFADTLKGFTSPIRSVIGAVTGLIGIFSTLAAVAGLVVLGFQKITEAARKKAEAIEAAKKSFKEYLEQLEKIQKTTLEKSDDPVKEIINRYDTQIEKERELYDELIKQRLKLRIRNDNDVTSSIIDERDQRLAALEKSKQQAISAEVTLSEFKVGEARKAQQKIDDDKKRADAERRLEERSAMLADIRKIAEAQADAEDYYAERDRARMREQQAQFAQIRNDINGLFNTSQLEVGINRVGSLIQTLIDKVGDNR